MTARRSPALSHLSALQRRALATALVCLASACAPPAAPAQRPQVPGQRAPRGAAQQPTAPAALPPLTQPQRAVVARTRVPALLPRQHIQRAVLTGEPTWFAAHIPFEDVVITLEGNLTAVEAPEIAAAWGRYPVGTRAAPRIAHNELVIEAAWLDAGIAWSLEVSCQQPDTNPRCVHDGFVRAMVADLVRVHP